MHIPNGILSDPVAMVTTAAAAAALGVAATRFRQSGESSNGRLMAVTGAAVFAAQMVNFSVDHGTSGHVIGAAMAAILLGPCEAILTMAVVLAAQSLVFGDGGLNALGANMLNMAVAGPLVGYAIYALVRRVLPDRRGAIAGSAAAAFGSVLAAAALCSFELAASGAYAATDVLSAMMKAHLAIGVGEAIVTVCVVAAVLSLRPDLIKGRRHVLAGRAMWAGVAIALVAAAVGGPLASTLPDGLESVAAGLNFGSAASATPAILSDYAMPGIAWQPLAIAVAGMAGVLVVFAATYGFGRLTTAKVAKHAAPAKPQRRG